MGPEGSNEASGDGTARDEGRAMSPARQGEEAGAPIDPRAPTVPSREGEGLRDSAPYGVVNPAKLVRMSWMLEYLTRETGQCLCYRGVVVGGGMLIEQCGAGVCVAHP